MTTHHDMNALFRAAARAGQLRFNDEGRLVPTEWTEIDESDTIDQSERHAEGSGDGGAGNEQYEGQSPRRRDPDMTELIRDAGQVGRARRGL